METKKTNLLPIVNDCDIMETGCRPLSTRNLDELERELAEIERRLLPVLNAIRAIRGKKPIYGDK